MKKHLEFKDDKSSKFWEIVVLNNRYTIRFGKIGTDGQSKTKEFSSAKEALQDAEKQSATKLKKGYVEAEITDTIEFAWFEELERELFTVYKEAILQYKSDSYKSIRLNTNGDSFALGLETKEDSDYWEYIDSDFWDDFERLEDFFDIESKNETWPANEDDIYYLNSFIICTALSKVYLKLKEDSDLTNYLKTIKHITVDFDDASYNTFNTVYPPLDIRKRVISSISKDSKNRVLLLDLWEDQLQGPAIDFLNLFGLKAPGKKDNTIEVFQSKLNKANSKDISYKKTIKLLEQDTEIIIELKIESSFEVIEKACGLLGESYKHEENYDKAIYWYKKGVEHLEHGYSSLNLLACLKNHTEDFKQMVEFGEQHLAHASKNDFDYAFYSYHYLGYAYIKTENEERAIELYKVLFQFINEQEKMGKVEEVSMDLQNIAKGKNAESKIAENILSWFSNTDTVSDQKTIDLNRKWWTSVPDEIKKSVLKLVEINCSIDEVSDLSLEMILKIESLNLKNYELKDISFLSQFKQLDILYLNKNNIFDLSPLKNLNSLKNLNISENPIKSLLPLKELIQLKKIDADRCEIKSLEGLEDLKKTEELNFKYNQISEISPLSKLINLKKVNLSDNLITDISPLKNCKKLEKISVFGNPIEGDYESLSSLNKLNKIDIDYSVILKTFSDKPHLVKDWSSFVEKGGSELEQKLNDWHQKLNEEGLIDILWDEVEEPGLEDLAKIMESEDHIDLEKNKLKNLEVFSPFKRVMTLYINGTGITDLIPIINWEFLDFLEISDNKIISLSPLKNMSFLEVLIAENCDIDNLEDLTKCMELKNLQLSNNRIESLSPLTKLNRIERLELNNNRLTSLEDLSALKELEYLEISGNSSLDLSPLGNCKELKSLKCENSKKISGLLNLAKLPKLRIIIGNKSFDKKELEEFKSIRADVKVG